MATGIKLLRSGMSNPRVQDVSAARHRRDGQLHNGFPPDLRGRAAVLKPIYILTILLFLSRMWLNASCVTAHNGNFSESEYLWIGPNYQNFSGFRRDCVFSRTFAPRGIILVNINDLILIQLQQQSVNSPHHSAPSLSLPLSLLFSLAVIFPWCLLSLLIDFPLSSFLSFFYSFHWQKWQWKRAILSTFQERWLLHYCSAGNNSCHLWGHSRGSC